MRDWLSTAELAALALPGLPATQRGWNEFAEREGWLTRTDKVRARKARGGGLEYHIDLLPPEAVAVIATRAIGAVALAHDLQTAAEIAPGADQLTLPAIESRDARLALVAAADRFARNGGLPRAVADMQFSALYNLEKITVDAWIRQAVKSASPRTIARWRQAQKSGALSSLGVDRGAARRGKGKLEQGEVRSFAPHDNPGHEDAARRCCGASGPQGARRLGRSRAD